MNKHLFHVLATLVYSVIISLTPAYAGDNDITLNPTLVQSEFDKLVDELGLGIAYNPVAPAESLGITGFDLGVAVTFLEIDDVVWDKAVSDSSAPSTLPIPRLIVRKGLPLGIDLGVSYTSVPGSNVEIIGGEIRKAIFEGSSITPAVTVMLHMSELSGVDDIDLSTYGIDLGISKGLTILTPYAGIGHVWIDGSETSASVTLNDRDTSESRVYVGVRIGLMPIMSLAAQADFATTNSYSINFSLGF